MCSNLELQKARREIKAILVEKALSRQDISYSVLAKKITSCTLEHDSQELHALLGEISEQESNNNRGMLSVLVVRKDNGYPGKGFFTCAQSLEYKIDPPKQARYAPPVLEQRHKDFCENMKKTISNYYSDPNLKARILKEIKNHNGNIRLAIDVLEEAGVL
jgi:hypothetical protein